MDFLNQILHNDNNLLTTLSEIEVGIETADDETELDAAISAEIAAEFVGDSVSSQMCEPSTSQQSNSPLSKMDELEALGETKDGSCIACHSNLASIVFLGCNHNAVCPPC